MSLPPDLQRRLSAYLDDEMSVRAPAAVTSDALAVVARTHRRPAWRIPERWIPMPLTMRLAVVPRAFLYVLLLALLAAVLAAGGLVVGSLRGAAVAVPPPYGPARNGLIALDADGDIWVVNPDGTGLRQLTTGPAFEHGPAWSRDGTRIAFWSQETQGGPSSLIVADADGSDPIVIATDDAGRTPLQFLDWSPDGGHVTYSLGTDPAYTMDSRVFVAATDGSTGARQTGDPDLTARQPSWSPDGTLIAFSGSAAGGIEESYYPDQGVYLMAADGTGVRRLSKVSSGTLWEFYRTEWSPDGRRLASTVRDHAWVFEADGSAEGPLTASTSGAALVPRWSPDGETILFVGDASLETVPSSGGERTALLDPGSGFIWSPDGTVVATYDPGELRLLDVATGERVATVAIGDQSYPDIYHYPSWQRLAFES